VDHDQIRVFIHYQPQFVGLMFKFLSVLLIDAQFIVLTSLPYLMPVQTVSFPCPFYAVGE